MALSRLTEMPLYWYYEGIYKMNREIPQAVVEFDGGIDNSKFMNGMIRARK